MINHRIDSPPKIFRFIYLSHLIVIAAILLIYTLIGLFYDVRSDDGWGFVIFLPFVALVYLVTPLCMPFLILNIWGLMKYKNRLRYLIMIPILGFWIPYGFYLMEHTVFP